MNTGLIAPVQQKPITRRHAAFVISCELSRYPTDLNVRGKPSKSFGSLKFRQVDATDNRGTVDPKM